MTDVDSGRADDSVGAGAPADDIEISQAMREAGAFAWAKGDSEFDSPEEIAVQIFRAMMRARTSAYKA